MAPASVHPGGFWPRLPFTPSRLAVTKLLSVLSIVLYGCGGATAPCPTPVTDLDRHREESAQAQRAASKAASEARAADARRAEAVRRVAASRAAHDSLSLAHDSPGNQSPEP